MRSISGRADKLRKSFLVRQRTTSTSRGAAQSIAEDLPEVLPAVYRHLFDEFGIDY